MTNFKPSLPTDIPWRRIAVSHDMMEPGLCGDERPPRFRSSLAVFGYVRCDESGDDESGSGASDA
jgi:hypothetical protein